MQIDEYEKMYAFEKNHWWFFTKRKLIKQFIERFSINKKNLTILDLGCGTGAMLEELEILGKPFGIDGSQNVLPALTVKKIKDVALMQAEHLGFKDKTFDVIIASDVLEHIREDGAVLEEINRVLKNQGLCIITVPAYQSLWSYHDVALHHLRRYNKKELQQKILSSKMDIAFISYFYCFTLPLLIILRMIKAGLGGSTKPVKSDTDRVPKPINRFLSLVMKVELFSLRKIRLPFGSSLVCAARKSK